MKAQYCFALYKMCSWYYKTWLVEIRNYFDREDWVWFCASNCEEELCVRTCWLCGHIKMAANTDSEGKQYYVLGIWTSRWFQFMGLDLWFLSHSTVDRICLYGMLFVLEWFMFWCPRFCFLSLFWCLSEVWIFFSCCGSVCVCGCA